MAARLTERRRVREEALRGVKRFSPGTSPPKFLDYYSLKNMFYYVYVLYSLKDKKLYVGFTNNLKRRIEEHNKGLAKSTKYRQPLELVCFEAYRNRKDAMRREKFLKSGWGRNYLKKVLQSYFQELER